jgi:choline monooxygenase
MSAAPIAAGSPTLSLAARYYTAPEAQALDRRAVFARGWQLAGHTSSLTAPGDHTALEIAGLPALTLRDEHGALRAFHNVCRHRAGPLAVGTTCGAKRLRCRYHGWTYGFDGRLLSAPEMDAVDGFDKSRIQLPELALTQWQGLLFVSEAPAVGLDEVLQGISERVSYSFADFRFDRQQSYELDCDWKVYVDNYLEGYHVPHIHPGLNRLLDYRSYITELADWHSLQYSPLQGDTALYGSGEALYYFIYPNTMLNILPGRLQTNRVLPLGPGRCRVEFDYYYPADSQADDARRAGDIAFSDEVQDEDRWICEAVQRGLASGSYQPGPLNPRRESAVAHFQDLLRRDYAAAGAVLLR